MIRSVATICILFLFTGNLVAQYVWPVATSPALSANFGELRSNHFHMGLDARTEQRENLAVKSIDNGFISRVKIESWGFGRAIYIDHPNGVTSLYAHLNDFYPEFEQWVKEQQYKIKSWAVDIIVPPNLFKVTKGQTIAYSGNTGGSMGPHLHFELRDTKTETVLNPLVHGFVIKDNISPDILHLAWYDRCESIYEQTPNYISLKKINGVYTTSSITIVNTDKVSFGITAFDKYTGSTNKNGIYKAQLIVDGKQNCSFILDSIGYDKTRLLNAHIDYKTKADGGPYIQLLTKLPGNTGDFYKGENGTLELNDTSVREIEILVSDPENNVARIKFKIRSADKLKNHSEKAGLRFDPEKVNVFENDKVSFFLPPYIIYDYFNFIYKESKDVSGNIVYSLHNTTVPLNSYFKVNIKDDSFTDPQKVVMKRYSGSKKDFVKTEFLNGTYSASFREFGNFILVEDTLPPTISAITKTAAGLSFHIKDNTEELQNFNAYINGKWVRFSNDKQRAFIYKFDENCPAGENELTIYVEDLAGNKAEKKVVFKR